MISLLGTVTLNCSFILYLIYYLPQILHNRRSENIAQLSFAMHFLLSSAYVCDLLYGYAMHLPWQYRIVSWIGLGCLIVQHWQLSRYFWRERNHAFLSINMLSVFLLFGIFWDFFSVSSAELSQQSILIIGYIARFCFIFCALPQVWKSRHYESTTAISLHFIYLNMILIILDFISAWCLDWGWPNKLGGVPMIVLMIYLLRQSKSIEKSIDQRHSLSLPVK